MRHLGNQRIEAMALAIVAALDASQDLKLRDRGLATRAIVASLKPAFQVDPELDQAARARIESLSRDVPEGSREWDVLYRQYIEELSARRR